MKKYDIAAYVWPAYTGDEIRTRIFWPEGIGEWQTVKNMKNKGEYEWNRKPLWGYVNEANSYVMEMEIEAATDHGVNVFIYDWYWYDNRPFLENCLNDGFLKAKNHHKMKFYLMWANHDVSYTWDKRISCLDATIWSGKVNMAQFKVIGKRWIEKYFNHPSYYCIDDKPVLSIYDMYNFVNGLGGIPKAKEALDWLDEEVKKSGRKGIHIQLIKYGEEMLNLSGVDNFKGDMAQESICRNLDCDSITHYQYVHFTDVDKNYCEITKDVLEEWETARQMSKEYFPHVSVGWDNNPRFQAFRDPVVKNNTPEEFEKVLLEAKKYVDENNTTPLITINSWNEWTETSYLEPDNLYGYGYLEAIKRVFK